MHCNVFLTDLGIENDAVVEVRGVYGDVLGYRLVLRVGLVRLDGEWDVGEVEGREAVVVPDLLHKDRYHAVLDVVYLIRKCGGVDPVGRSAHHDQRLPSEEAVLVGGDLFATSRRSRPLHLSELLLRPQEEHPLV